MATILDKDLVRETTIKVDNREILLTISSDQSIRMKLKGMKSGEVSIDILKLYNMLIGKSEDELEESPKERSSIVIINDDDDEDKHKRSGVMIDLNDLRSHNAISTLDVPTLAKFDGIISEMLKHQKEIQGSLKQIRSHNKKKK